MLRTNYPTRQVSGQGGTRTEYKFKGKWRTISGWAREYGSDYKTMRKRISKGYEPGVAVGSYYVTGGDLCGYWVRMGFLKDYYKRSEQWFTDRRESIDGFWTIDLSPEAEAQRKAESREARSKAASIRAFEAAHDDFPQFKVAADFVAARRSPMAAWR